MLQLADKLQGELSDRIAKTDFFQQAVRIAQLRTAAKVGQPEAAIGAEEVISALAPADPQAEDVRWLFETDAALRFSGNTTAATLKEDERLRVQSTLKALA